MVITLGPDPALQNVITAILLVNPSIVLDQTSVEFRPRGIRASLFAVTTMQGRVEYTGAFDIDSDAESGPRDVFITIDLTTIFGTPLVVELECPDAFTVIGGATPTFFNGPIAFTSPPESPTEPACGCRGEPTYNRGISQIPDGCSGGPSSLISGIRQDAGMATVFLHNGEFNHYVVDLEIPGRGFNWRFERKYRSGIIFEGPLGHNWEFNYNRRLFVEPRGDVLRMDGYGRADRYRRVGDQFVSPTGFYSQLIENPDRTFIERDRTGAAVTYDRPDRDGIARMKSLSDHNGNTMRFEYNRRGQLTRVIDTLGRPIEYRYNRQGRLIEVKDFFNRSITFDYDRNGDLVAVTSPAVTDTPNGNDFPQGKTERYAYMTGGRLDQQLRHNLMSITAPNEVASGGPARVIIEYETNPRSPNFDRVISQTIGGMNESGVPAGGTIVYDYQALEAKADDINTPVGQTTVIDRNGNVSEYQFNQLGNIVRVREFTNRQIRPNDPEFYETRYEYNEDGELTRVVYPEGNSIEYVYDEANPDRFQQGNLLAEIHHPDAARGGDQSTITVSYTYEPIYNQVRAVTEARGNDPSYAPQNGGAASPARYTTRYVFDYQEGENVAALAEQIGLTEDQVRTLLEQAGVPMGLGDVNGDGRTDHIAGNVIKTIRPTATLLPDANLARVEGGTRQPIEEIYAYNQFGQVIRRVDPEQNVTLYEYHPENDPDGDGMDLTAGVSSEPFGYLKAIIQDAESAPARNSRTNPPPAAIRTQFFYDRVGNVTRVIDGRGIATEYVVNQLNQVVQIIRAADVTGALQNPEEPRFADCSDPTLVECSDGMTAFRYLTNIFYDFNDNVVRAEVENRDSNNRELAGEFVEYTRSYDILDNPIESRREVSERPREVLITRYRYDRNENRVLTISPMAVAGEQPSNVVSAVFDERDLLFTSTRGGLTDQFQSLEAHMDIPEVNQIPNSADLSTFARVYDGNRNLIEFIDGADNSGDGRPEVTTTLYDGFDRRVSVIDAVGNQSFINYDPASNIVRLSNFGPVGGPSPRNNRAATLAQPLSLRSFRQPLLRQIEYKYDELGRLFERDNILFDYRRSGVSYMRTPVLQDGPLGGSNDGRVVTRYEYDRNSRLRFVIEDDLSTLETRYDGVNRVIRRIDPEQNEVLYTYDDNHNVVKVLEVDVTQRDDVQTGKVPDLRETFTTINVYDSLNRLIRATDNLGQTRRFHYDSRNNMIFTSDSQRSPDPADLIADPLGLFPAGTAVSGRPPSGLHDAVKAGAHRRSPLQAQTVSRINRPGNTTEYFYDGINRRIAAVRHLRIDGQGENPIDTSNPANPDGLIVTDYDWDANSRLIAIADDGSLPGDQNTSIGVIEAANPKGNVTRYVYDDLNRLARELFDDGTINDYGYDADDNLVRRIDENGSLVNNTYDGINRLVRRDITRATSDMAHPAGGFKDPGVTWQVIGTTLQQFEYDGLSRMARSFDNNNPDDPSDDAILTLAFDSLSRRLEEVQNGRAVSGRWLGDNNRSGLVYPNGRELAFTFDKLDRIDQISDRGPGTGDRRSVVDYDYIGPGRVLERTYSNGVRLTYLDNARQQDVGYDGLRRVVEHRHLGANNILVAGFAYDYDREEHRLFEIKQHMGDLREDYAYDSRYRLTRFARQGEPEDAWQLDGANNWVRRQGAAIQANNVNEMASLDGVSQLHDDNGNLIDDGAFRYQYDFANRLRRVVRKADNAVIAVYRYDAHNRRTERIVSNTGLFDDRVQYLYDGRRAIEERREGHTQQYVYGRWIDEPLTLDQDVNNDGIVDQTFFYHQDGKTYVAALTDASGQIVEEVAYDAYGRPSLEMSSVGNPYLFTGRRYDPEVGLYYYRARHYDPLRGRFLQRDPIGMWTDAINLGNGYTFVGNDAINGLDPSGLGPGDPYENLDVVLVDKNDKSKQTMFFGPGDPFENIGVGLMAPGPDDPFEGLDVKLLPFGPDDLWDYICKISPELCQYRPDHLLRTKGSNGGSCRPTAMAPGPVNGSSSNAVIERILQGQPGSDAIPGPDDPYGDVDVKLIDKSKK